jgi:hypothetical protein
MAEKIMLRDDSGKLYDADVLKNLYAQISSNFDASRSSGGVYGEKISDRTNIGFNAKEAKKVLGQTPTATQMVMLDMARGLAQAGVTDVSQLKAGEVEVQYPGGPESNAYTEKQQGIIKPDGTLLQGLGTTYAGKGGTSYNVDMGSDGKPKFYTAGYDTSDKDSALKALSVLSPFALGPLIGAAGSGLAGTLASNLGLSATAANALASGLVHGTLQGGIADLAGGKFGKGFLQGAISGAAPVVAGPAMQALTNAGLSPELAKIVTSGGIGGLSAAAGGKDIGAGALGAALNTGIGIGMDKMGLDKLPVPVKGIATQGIASALTGKPFDAGQAIQNAAINYGLNQTLGPQGAKALNTFMQFKNMSDGLKRIPSSSRALTSAQQSAMDKFKAFKAGRL